jgi:multiple sugar transport system substrate-binding protein
MTASNRRRGGRASHWLAALASISLCVTACGGDSGDTEESSGGGEAPEVLSQAEIDEALQTPTELTFWTWVPDIENEVALFEKKYPAIDVKVVNAGQGEPQYTKLRTALQAGTGAPDAVQIEFQYIPTFTITESLLDLRPYGAEALQDEFVEWTWSQVTGPNGEVWAYPQDTGPMGMLYREDIFDKHGIEVPATWDEFAEAARELHAADPEVYLTNMAANQGGSYMGLLWQGETDPFTIVAEDEIGINLNDEASKNIATYWSDLINEGVISADPDFTDQWFQALNRGTYATWLTAAWGPVFLSGSAASTSGKWRAAPLPQWEAGQEIAGNWGGSTTAVINTTKNPIAAAELAKFINTDPESTKMFATEQFLFPATNALLSDPEFVGQKPEFYGGQAVNELFAQISDTVPLDFEWAPFMDQVYTDWDETIGKSFADASDSAAAADEWQSRVTSYAENQGFTVAE